MDTDLVVIDQILADQTFQTDEEAMRDASFAEKKLRKKMNDSKFYKSRLIITKSPLYLDKKLLMCMNSEENADEFVRNINKQMVESALEKN